MIESKLLTIEDLSGLNLAVENLKSCKGFANAEILFENLKQIYISDPKLANKLNLQYIRPFYAKAFGSNVLTTEKKNESFLKYKSSLLFSSVDDFDCFMLYMEFDRPLEQRFWFYRRSKLMPVCKALQELSESLLDLLFIELPPRVGKSTLGLWFVVWYSAKKCSQSSLLVGHTAGLVKTFFGEILTFMESPVYKFFDVFPALKDTLQTQAKELFLDLGEKSRYTTFACKSILAAMAGIVEASRLLYLDDLIEDIQEALSPSRLEMKWTKVNTDVMQRKANSRVPLLSIGTPWAKNDPQAQLYEKYSNDPLYRVKRIQIPATDDYGHSNFNYNENLIVDGMPFPIGFNDEFYRKQKDIMDDISYQALYMLQRLDREGLLFQIDKFERFDGTNLVDKPTAIHAFCDVAWGGGDYLSMPIVYEYKDGFYLADVVFCNKDKIITQPKVCGMLQKHNCYQANFEANNGGDEYAETIRTLLKENHAACNIKYKKSENNSNAKIQRIIMRTTDIQKIKILKREHQSAEYKKFIENIIVFNQNGKNKNDDAPDSLALLFNEIIKPQQCKVTKGRRRAI